MSNIWNNQHFYSIKWVSATVKINLYEFGIEISTTLLKFISFRFFNIKFKCEKYVLCKKIASFQNYPLFIE